MSRPDPPGVWPAWARYTFVAVFAAILVGGVVSVALHGLDGQAAVVRILIAAVVVPALLTPLRLFGLRRRSDRLREKLFHQLAELRLLVEQERDVPPAARTTGASDTRLTRVADQIQVVRDQLTGAPGDQVVLLVEQLADLGADWPADAPAARLLAQCARRARRLGATARRGDGRRRGTAPAAGVTGDGHAFRVQPRWKEEVVYWEGADGFVFDAGWGSTPPTLYVPSASMWDDVVPVWMQGRRDAIVRALRDTSGHVLHEDDHGWYRNAPASRVLAGT